MNLVLYYFNKTLEQVILRYYSDSYHGITMADFRTKLIREYHCEYIRRREVPGNKLHSWEIRARNRTYFFDYEVKSKILKLTGVR